MDIGQITQGLERDDRGVWTAKIQSGISYPEEGNALIFPAEDTLFWFRHRNRCITTLVDRFSPDAVLLDIGGGNGVVSKALNDSGVETVLLEPGREGVKNALGRGIAQIICATLEEARFLPGSLDAVGMFDVLEHIQDDRAWLGTINTLLKPGGWLYLTVPAFQFLWSHEDDFAGHYRRYTLAALRALLHETEFKEAYATYIFSFLPSLSFITRTLLYRLRLDRWLSMDREKAVHIDLGGLGRLIEIMLHPEVLAVRKGASIPIGGSCLLAARKLG